MDKEPEMNEKDTLMKKYGLRKYQADSVEETIRRFCDAEYENRENEVLYHLPVLLVMPTGMGKTITAIAACLELCEKGVINRVIWIAHRTELCTQAGVTYNNTASDSCKKSLRFLTYMNNSFNRSLDDLLKSDAAEVNSKTLVVYDEAHHSTAKTFRLEDVKRRGAKVLGLTATPFRSDCTGFLRDFAGLPDEDVKPVSRSLLINRAKESVVEKYTPKDRADHLCRLEDRSDFVRDHFKDTKSMTASSDSYLLQYAGLILKIIDDKNGNRKLKSGKILVFARSDTGKGLYDALVRHGVRCGLVFSDEIRCSIPGFNDGSMSDRDAVIKCFDSADDKGSVEVMINNAILTEGFDQPKITDIVLLYDTGSRISMTQIIGRGLRKCDEFEKENCCLYPAASYEYIKAYEGPVENLYSELKSDMIMRMNDAYNSFIDPYGDGAKYSKRAWYAYIQCLRENPDDQNTGIAGVIGIDGEDEIYISASEKERLESTIYPERWLSSEDSRNNGMRKRSCGIPYYYPQGARNAVTSALAELSAAETNDDRSCGEKQTLSDELCSGAYRMLDPDFGDGAAFKETVDRNVSAMINAIETEDISVNEAVDRLPGPGLQLTDREFYRAELLKELMRSVCHDHIKVPNPWDDRLSEIEQKKGEITGFIKKAYLSIDHEAMFFMMIKNPSEESAAKYDDLLERTDDGMKNSMIRAIKEGNLTDHDHHRLRLNVKDKRWMNTLPWQKIGDCKTEYPDWGIECYETCVDAVRAHLNRFLEKESDNQNGMKEMICVKDINLSGILMPYTPDPRDRMDQAGENLVITQIVPKMKAIAASISTGKEDGITKIAEEVYTKITERVKSLALAAENRYIEAARSKGLGDLKDESVYDMTAGQIKDAMSAIDPSLCEDYISVQCRFYNVQDGSLF